MRLTVSKVTVLQQMGSDKNGRNQGDLNCMTKQLNSSSSLKLTIPRNFYKSRSLFFLSWHYRLFIINTRLEFTNMVRV
jgi:hypothetical protein